MNFNNVRRLINDKGGLVTITVINNQEMYVAIQHTKIDLFLVTSKSLFHAVRALTDNKLMNKLNRYIDDKEAWKLVDTQDPITMYINTITLEVMTPSRYEGAIFTGSIDRDDDHIKPILVDYEWVMTDFDKYSHMSKIEYFEQIVDEYERFKGSKQYFSDEWLYKNVLEKGLIKLIELKHS